MLLRLLRTHLRPYAGNLSMVVVLQLIGTIASLYLPSLNADIIDKGVAKGDTGYIVGTGGWMLGISLVQIVCSIAAVYFGAKTAMGFRPRRARRASSTGSASSPPARWTSSARRR